MSDYLPLAEFKTKLLATKAYTPETLPEDSLLEMTLETSQVVFEEWMGRRMLPTSYTETGKTDHRGIILLRQSPVISVEEIILLPIQQYGYTATPLSLGPFLANWWQGRKINTGRPGVTVRITYTAGVEPLPPIINLVFFQLAKEVATKGNGIDTGFLHQPTSDVQSISLPGGISKSFKVADLKTGSDAGPGLGTSVLDRILSPANRYRFAYIT